MRVKAMKVVITLAGGTFANGTNQKIIYATSLPNYLHAQAIINRNTGINGNTCNLTIFGMTVEDCNSLAIINPDALSVSNLNTQLEIYADYIDPPANADGSYDQDYIIQLCDVLPMCFLGQVISGSPNYNDVNRPFTIEAMLAGASSYKLLNTTVAGSTTFKSLVQSILDVFDLTKSVLPTDAEISYTLGTVVPDTVVTNGIYSGSLHTQLQQLCHDYGYQYWESMTKNDAIQLNFTQVGIGINSTSILKPDDGSCTGMIGYPTSSAFGILVVAFFNPTRQVGSCVTVESSATIYNGDWRIWSSQSMLSTQEDAWQSTFLLYEKTNV